MRHPRHAAPRRPLAHARDRPARDDGCRRDGRRAFAERLPLEGDVLRRDLALPDVGFARWIVPIVATAAGMFGVAYSTRFVHDVFFNGPPRTYDRTPHEPPRWMRLSGMVSTSRC
jgi:hypothetical protein